MPTILDVANEAGVSKTTVSRILNKQGNFNKNTIQKVLDTADRLGYQPNEVARTLGKCKSQTIALILPTIQVPVFVELQSALEEEFYAHGYKVILFSSLYDREKEKKTLQMLTNNMIDGIVFGSFTNDISHFSSSSLPLISVGRKMTSDIPVVKSNDYAAGILAARHLLGKKCKDIIYVTTHPENFRCYDERFLGFQSIMNEKGVNFHTYQFSVNQQIHNDYSLGLTQILLDHPETDGIFAETDLLAMACIQSCSRLGYSVPGDIKIIGYGNLFFSSLTSPALTTIHEDKKAAAKAIVELMINMIDAPEEHYDDIILPVSLIERQTT